MVVLDVWISDHFVTIDDSGANASTAALSLPREFVMHICRTLPNDIRYGAFVILSVAVVVANKSSEALFVNADVSKCRVFCNEKTFMCISRRIKGFLMKTSQLVLKLKGNQSTKSNLILKSSCFYSKITIY